MTRHNVALVLSVIVAMQAVAVGVLGLRGGFSSLANWTRAPAPMRRVQSLEEWQALLARDPKPGTLVPEQTAPDESGGLHRIPAPARPVGLLFVDRCSSCVSDTLTRWDRVQRGHPEADLFVVPAAADARAIREFKREYGVSVRFLTAGCESLSGVLNPFFPPRAYVCDATGRLACVQPPSASAAAGITQASAHLSGTLPRPARQWKDGRP